MQRPFAAYQGDDPYVFVCYAHADAPVVYPEIARLKGLGFNIWYDEGVAPGRTWRDEVARALTQCSVFLYFVTPRSVASPNCRKEVNFCLSRERRILAVHLETTDLPDGLELSLSDVQAIVVADHAASSWQHKLGDALSAMLPERATTVAPRPAPVSARRGPSIAVLPLANRSTDPENEYLCDGIAEELIGGLAGVGDLTVASLLSSFAFRNQHLDAREMGERLGVEHILSGSVQKAGNRVRIAFLLTQARDGTSLWSTRYDREIGDIFELQGEVAGKVVEALRVELTADERRNLRDVGTTQGTAYDAYLVGLHAARGGNRKSLLRAVDHLSHAVHIDPSLARAHWWLYFCYWRLIGEGEPRAEMEPRGEVALQRARAAGFVPPVPWIKARRDLIPSSRPDQRTLAHEACEKIRTPDPEWRLFEYVQLGECLTAAGLHEGACAFYEQYLERVTHDLSGTWIPGRYRSLLVQTGRYDKSIDFMVRVGMGGQSLVYARSGQYALAQEALAREAVDYRFDFDRFYLLFWRGDTEAARTYCQQYHESQFWLLERYWIHFLFGELEQGLGLLEEDVRLGAHPAVFRSNIGEVLPQSTMRALEAHPRYQAILESFGIDAAWAAELMAMANELTSLTGIHVAPDRGS